MRSEFSSLKEHYETKLRVANAACKEQAKSEMEALRNKYEQRFDAMEATFQAQMQEMWKVASGSCSPGG